MGKTGVSNKMGEWRPGAILTASGRMVCPLDPDPDLIVIEDIAHALGNLCRFTGHTRRIYTVAEHCCLGLPFAPPERRLQWLLHDAAEAYLGDVATPIKQARNNTFARDAERLLLRVIAKRFDVPVPYELPDCLTKLDLRLLATEKRDLMPDHPGWPHPGVEPLPIMIAPVSHEDWGARFLEEFELLCGIRQAEHAGRTAVLR